MSEAIPLPEARANAAEQFNVLVLAADDPIQRTTRSWTGRNGDG